MFFCTLVRINFINKSIIRNGKCKKLAQFSITKDFECQCHNFLISGIEEQTILLLFNLTKTQFSYSKNIKHLNS